MNPLLSFLQVFFLVRGKEQSRFRDVKTGRFMKTPEMYHLAISIKFVEHNEYWDITAHFYGSDNDCRDYGTQKEMVKKIYKEWERQTGYKQTEIWFEEPKQYSDIEPMKYDKKLYGEIELDAETIEKKKKEKVKGMQQTLDEDEGEEE